MMIRSSSIRDSDSVVPLSVPLLDQMLSVEMKGAILDHTASLITLVFSDQNLPFEITKLLLLSLITVYDKDHWISLPDGSKKSWAQWLNAIGKIFDEYIGGLLTLNILGKALAGSKQRTLCREWSAGNHASPLEGSSVRRKPDIVLLDNCDMNEGQIPEWKHVRALGEVTTQNYLPQRIKSTVRSKAYVAMNEQHDRRFIIAISFFAESSFQLTLCDRAGIIHSPTYDIHKDPLYFLRVLTGLMFGDETVLGYDSSIRRNSDNEIETIIVNGAEYHVLRRLFSSTALRGRATRCWHVEREGKQYVIKDSWVHMGRTTSEIDILQDIHSVQFTPTIVDGWDVAYPSREISGTGPRSAVVDSTRLHRVGLDYPEARVHRRIVMQPVGETIHSFVSKKELIGAFIDIITGMSAVILAI